MVTKSPVFFKDVNEAMVAAKKMTATQKESMLLDMVWRAYVNPEDLKPKSIVVRSYNTSILIP